MGYNSCTRKRARNAKDRSNLATRSDHLLQTTWVAGPHPGKRHEFMKRPGVRVIIPNPHHGDISQSLLQRILKEAGISREEWEAL